MKKQNELKMKTTCRYAVGHAVGVTDQLGGKLHIVK